MSEGAPILWARQKVKQIATTLNVPELGTEATHPTLLNSRK